MSGRAETRRLALVGWLAENGAATTETIADARGRSPRRVLRDLCQLGDRVIGKPDYREDRGLYVTWRLPDHEDSALAAWNETAVAEAVRRAGLNRTDNPDKD